MRSEAFFPFFMHWVKWQDGGLNHCGYSATVANNFCLPLRQISADLIQISQYLLPNYAEQFKKMQNNLIFPFQNSTYFSYELPTM